MESTTLYEKVGRRYIPIKELYSGTAYPDGFHLVYCSPGRMLVRFRINPEYAELTAAAEIARDAMIKAIQDCKSGKPGNYSTPKMLTPKELAAWDELNTRLGCNSVVYPSSHEIVDAGIKVLTDNATDSK